MENKKGKDALNDELLDKVSGGAGGGPIRPSFCDDCGGALQSCWYDAANQTEYLQCQDCGKKVTFYYGLG